MKTLITLLLLSAAAFAQATITDPRDGKKYKTVKIGNQVWMAQDLDYSGEDGDIGSCLDNNPNNCSKYGRLYGWENAMLSCPDGWHLPDDAAWQALASFAGGSDVAGRKLRARSGWEKWDCEFTSVDDRGRTTKVSKCNSDNYGFSASPSTSNGNYGYWWLSSETYYGAAVAWMQHNSENMRIGNDNKSKSFNVRCLKGEKKLPANLVAKKNAVAKAEAEKKAEKKAEAENPLTTEVSGETTILRGSTLARKLAWLTRNVESHNTYIIEVSANENIIPYIFEYKGAINVTIILRGDDENRTIRLQSHGIMFAIKPNVVFVLDNNITLQGHSGNNSHLVGVQGGTFKMNAGATITGNHKSRNDDGGGGVYIDNNGTFTMDGGVISGNTAAWGGGVFVPSGTFTMNSGKIIGNTARENGGGVDASSGIFYMNGGIISDNTALHGGGVYLWQNGTFIMRDGTITHNTASKNGGGLFILTYHKAFSKTGGTITGYNSDRDNGNVVKDDEGTIARRGHAVYVDEKRRKETTADSWLKLSTSDSKVGGWDD